MRIRIGSFKIKEQEEVKKEQEVQKEKEVKKEQEEEVKEEQEECKKRKRPERSNRKSRQYLSPSLGNISSSISHPSDGVPISQLPLYPGKGGAPGLVIFVTTQCHMGWVPFPSGCTPTQHKHRKTLPC